MPSPMPAFGFKTHGFPFSPISVGTGTIQDAPKGDQTAHIFSMSDGNVVALYFDGANGGYRIKAAGTWGAFTAFATNSGQASTAYWTRNGDTLYGITGNASATQARIRKLVYAAGVITETSGIAFSSGATDYTPRGIFYDTANDRVWGFYTFGGASPPEQYSAFVGSTMAFQTAATFATAAEGNAPTANHMVIPDGASAFIYAWANGTTVGAVRIVVSATAVTSETAETGVPAAAAAVQAISAIYDGTNWLIIVNENNAKLRLTTRSAANTYSALSDLITATLGAATIPALFRKSTNDLALVFRNNTSQANGEIYYIRRKSGVWDASPGTLLAGGAATGFSNPSAAANDLNMPSGAARVLYMTGTANPFTVTENGINL